MYHEPRFNAYFEIGFPILISHTPFRLPPSSSPHIRSTDPSTTITASVSSILISRPRSTPAHHSIAPPRILIFDTPSTHCHLPISFPIGDSIRRCHLWDLPPPPPPPSCINRCSRCSSCCSRGRPAPRRRISMQLRGRRRCPRSTKANRRSPRYVQATGKRVEVEGV